MAVYFYNGLPLFVDGQLAMDEDCCCSNPPCCHIIFIFAFMIVTVTCEEDYTGAGPESHEYTLGGSPSGDPGCYSTLQTGDNFQNFTIDSMDFCCSESGNFLEMHIEISSSGCGSQSMSKSIPMPAVCCPLDVLFEFDDGGSCCVQGLKIRVQTPPNVECP